MDIKANIPTVWAEPVEWRRGPSEGRTKSSMSSNTVFSLRHPDTSSLSARITAASLQRQSSHHSVIHAVVAVPTRTPRRATPRRHFQFQQHAGRNKDSHVPSVHSELYFYRSVPSQKGPGRHRRRGNIRSSAALVPQVSRRQRHKTRV